MLRLIRKALDYYQYEGLTGVAASGLRRLLWSSREAYRTHRWAHLSKQVNLAIPLGSLNLTLDPYDTGISRELAIEGTHEPTFTRLLLQLVQEGMTVVDIGTNIGYYALQIAMRVGKTGQVIAFEPSPRTYNLLQHNIHQNQITNIQALPYAIGAVQEEIEFFLYEQSNWNSFVKHGTPIGKVRVPVYPLDAILPYFAAKVDLIRMDIEGYETQAIHGMENTLNRYRPIICMELHCSFIEYAEIRNLLEGLFCMGYEVKYAIQRSKDEVYWGRLLAPRKRLVETIRLHDLLKDKRVRIYRENFSLILSSDRRSSL